MKYIASILLLTIFFFSSCSKRGKQLPELEFQTIEGNTIETSKLEGKVVVLNVWATWCGTCVREMPQLNHLVADFKDRQDVVFIAFSDEDQTLVESFLDHIAFNYQHVVNAKHITDKLQSRMVKTFPQNLVVGKDGLIVFDESDASKDVYNELKASIESALNK